MTGASGGDVDLAAVGALLADRTRAAMLTTLLNGGLTPASYLAARARVSRSLASTHLRRLVDGGLVVVEPRGRQRLYRLAGQHVAEALEALILIAPPAVVRSLAADTERDQLREARLCYDHVAGRVGVRLVDGLVGDGALTRTESGFDVTPRGVAAFARLGVDVAQLGERPRPLARACMDWSERSDHLAGSLGAAVTAELLRRDWLRGREASRVVDLTDAGRRGLETAFGIDLGATA